MQTAKQNVYPDFSVTIAHKNVNVIMTHRVISKRANVFVAKVNSQYNTSTNKHITRLFLSLIFGKLLIV